MDQFSKICKKRSYLSYSVSDNTIFLFYCETLSYNILQLV